MTIEKEHAWRYAKIGNRISRQNGSEIIKTSHNSRNQIDSERAGGWMKVRGVTDEPAKVKIRSNGNPFSSAALHKDNGFSGWVETVEGENIISIEATDTGPRRNPTPNSYSVDVHGTARTLTYDLTGNTVSDGDGRTFSWDAEDRLVKITYADASSTSFTYDGLSRRSRIVERNASNVVTGDKRYVWADGSQPAEERDSSGGGVSKQFHEEGEFNPAAAIPLKKIYYTRDHLGSVRELVDSDGILRTRYDYDMWGKRSEPPGSVKSEVGYTGHHHHTNSALILTWYRAYDSELGRWLSPDPIGEEDSINLYQYVQGDPIGRLDDDGLRGRIFRYPNRAAARRAMEQAFIQRQHAQFQRDAHAARCSANLRTRQAINREVQAAQNPKSYNARGNGGSDQMYSWMDSMIIASRFLGPGATFTNSGVGRSADGTRTVRWPSVKPNNAGTNRSCQMNLQSTANGGQNYHVNGIVNQQGPTIGLGR